MFCKSCNKCLTCCSQSICRDQTSNWTVWSDLGASPKVVQILREGYPLPFRIRPKLARNPTVISCYVNPHRNSYLLEALHQLIDKNAVELVHNLQSLGFFLQQTIFSPEIKQQVETYTGSEQTQSFSQGGEIQNGNPGNHQNIPPTGGVGHLNRFQRCLLPQTVQKISQISCPRSDIPIQSTSVRSLNSHYGGIRIHQYLTRRLVGESQVPPSLSPAYPNFGANVSGPRMVSECGEIRTRTQAGFRLCRLPIRPQVRTGLTYTGPVANTSREGPGPIVIAGLSGPTVHVLDRSVNSHRKTGSPRPTAYEAPTVAPQEQLEGTRITGKDYSNTQITAPSFKMVAGGKQCATRSTITPFKTCSANLYRRIKRRVGRSLKRIHCQRDLVTARKQAAYKLFGTQGSVSCLKRVSKPLCRQDSTCGNRQHYSHVVHKQGRRHEVGHTLCPTMEDLDLVYQTSSNSKSPTYSRAAECGSRQGIQARPDHSNRIGPPSRGFPSYMQQVAPTSDRSICHEVQQQVASVRVTNTGLLGSRSGCTQYAMGGSGRIRLPTSGHLGQSGGEVAGLPLQENHSDCSGVDKHALVLGSSDHV